MELPKTYSPQETESAWYPIWEAQGYFQPSVDGKVAYSIVIPPPNVTGSLHMGHALNATLQDILTRWHRMRGDRTLWVPGTDHGGIATQNVVEKLLRSEKMTRFDLGREAFLERMWKWRGESGDTILMQLRRLGASCDWTRTRFTMDEVCSRAVREAFVRLYGKGLIYRGPRMVNWCPRCQTALADIEVEHEDRAGKLWHIRYPLEKGTGEIIVATTRPETMLGDTAVAVNPDDPRYASLIGQRLRLPLTERTIPIVADSAVDAAFGTGAVKVTPAHDPTDFEIGERHGLAHVVVIGFDGKMTEQAGIYGGLDRFDARKRIVEDLESQGYLIKTEDYKLAAAVCYRCATIIEPLVSDQWFMSMKDLASRAAQATRDGRVKIFPASWEKPYISWLDNIRDWCISRQIWWGHRIPVYYCPNSYVPPRTGSKTLADSKHLSASAPCSPLASVELPERCPACGSTELRQDEDVLDTWFSSALWPFSVFHWPEQTDDLKSFYPTNVLVTGHEILYLWVARMVMMGLEFMNDVPFRHVYIHGIVRDKQGKKMSKSLGNVIDPLDIMKQYGTDALRFSLAESSIPGRDMQLSNDSFLKARNFANKLWNVSRFVQMNLADYQSPENRGPVSTPEPEHLALADRWILDALQGTIAGVTEALGSYNPAEASRLLYEFAWGSLCDWYVEVSKVALTGNDPSARTAKQAMLVYILETTLRLLHPTMPFETETIYQSLKPWLATESTHLMIQPWPQADPSQCDAISAEKFRLVQNIVTAIRTLRSEAIIPPATRTDCFIVCSEARWTDLLGDAEVRATICFLAKIDQLTLGTEKDRPAEFLFTVFNGGEIYLPAQDLVDKVKERIRLERNRAQLEQLLTKGRAMLENRDFIERAPKEEVDNRRATLRETQQKLDWLARNLEGLSG